MNIELLSTTVNSGRYGSKQRLGVLAPGYHTSAIVSPQLSTTELGKFELPRGNR
jgi:hypothetical protein